MTERFTTNTPNSLSEIYDDKRILTNGEIIKYINWYREDMRKFSVENEQLKQQLSDIDGQLVMLDNCDNWDYDRMKHTVREIAEIIGYTGTINPKR